MGIQNTPKYLCILSPNEKHGYRSHFRIEEYDSSIEVVDKLPVVTGTFIYEGLTRTFAFEIYRGIILNKVSVEKGKLDGIFF